MSIDQRARSAVADLRVAAAVTEDNQLLPSRRGALALVVLLAVVAATGFLFLRHEDEDVYVGGIDPVGGSVQLVPTYVPQGFEVQIATDSDSGGNTQSVDAWQAYWGTPGDEPFSTVDLSVRVAAISNSGSVDLGLGYDEVDVNGRTAAILDRPAGRPGLRTIYYVPSDAEIVWIESYSMSDDELVAVARGLDLSAASVEPTVDPSTVPAGSDLLVSQLVAEGADGDRLAATTYSGPDRERGFTITATASGALHAELMARHQLGPGAIAQTVQGRSGWLAADGRVLVWWPSPDVIATMYAESLPVDELLAVAESIRPVGDEVWADVLAAGDGDVDSSSATTVIGGETDSFGIPLSVARIDIALADGRMATVYRDTNGDLCGLVGDDTGAGSSTCWPAGDLHTFYEGGRPAILYGSAPEGTASVGAAGLTGSVEDADGERLWGIVLAGDETPTEVIYLDEAGTEIGRAPVTP